jgi:hypothetical protein
VRRLVSLRRVSTLDGCQAKAAGGRPLAAPLAAPLRKPPKGALTEGGADATVRDAYDVSFDVVPASLEARDDLTAEDQQWTGFG